MAYKYGVRLQIIARCSYNSVTGKAKFENYEHFYKNEAVNSLFK